MTEEQGTLETNEQNQENPPKTLETKACSKEENKTISSTLEQIKKKKRPSQIKIESRNSTNGFYKYRNTSRTEHNK